MKKSVKSLLLACSIAVALAVTVLPANAIVNKPSEPTYKTMIHGEGA